MVEKLKIHSPEWAYEKVLFGHKVRPTRWNTGYVAFDRHFNYIEMFDDLGTVTKFPYRMDINQSELFNFSDHWEIVKENTLEKTSALQLNQDEDEKDLTLDEKNEELAKFYDSKEFTEKDGEKLKEAIEEYKKAPCRKPTTKKFQFSAEEIQELLINAGCNLEGYELQNYYSNSSSNPHLLIDMTFEAVLDD